MGTWQDRLTCILLAVELLEIYRICTIIDSLLGLTLERDTISSADMTRKQCFSPPQRPILAALVLTNLPRWMKRRPQPPLQASLPPARVPRIVGTYMAPVRSLFIRVDLVHVPATHQANCFWPSRPIAHHSKPSKKPHKFDYSIELSFQILISQGAQYLLREVFSRHIDEQGP
jgi:hypothetical protein